MIFTRIQRGAKRTKILLRNQLNRAKVKLPSGAVFALVRPPKLSTVAPLLLSLRMVTAPIPFHETVPTDPVEEPPSPSQSVLALLPRIVYHPTHKGAPSISPFLYDQYEMADVSIGKSVAMLAEEERQRIEAAQQAAANAAKIARAKRARSIPVFSGDKESTKEYVRQQTIVAFGEAEWPAMAHIIMRESGFNIGSYNQRSGACGLFQALPCSKMGGMEMENQVAWGIRYIRSRYGTPSQAWVFWQQHHWY
jgi:hypothetical protein